MLRKRNLLICVVAVAFCLVGTKSVEACDDWYWPVDCYDDYYGNFWVCWWDCLEYASPSDETQSTSYIDSGREGIKGGNAMQHQDDGQNVLFLDSHVGFEKDPFAGINDDNIYTYWDGGDVRAGSPPIIGSAPSEREDSLLVH